MTLRGLLTADRLYTWQDDTLHTAFERDTGLAGVRLRLRDGIIQINDETVAFPEHFPWIYGDMINADVDDRRRLVERWLSRDRRLTGRKFEWYS